MQISASAALWFLPFAAPLCLYIAFMDMRSMRIANSVNGALLCVFAVVGLFALPFDTYLWRYASVGVMLLVGMVMNAAGGMGGGDAKFLPAAAPFVNPGDTALVMMLFASALLGALVAHRLGKHSALRRMAPDWHSWTNARFPAGLALSGTLLIYLIAGVFAGA